MKRDVFGQPRFLKRFLIRVFGIASWRRFVHHYEPVITGAEVFNTLPDTNVLIVSNHQTYFADVMFMFHVIEAALDGSPNNIRHPGFLSVPKDNIYFVAAEETMKKGILPRIMKAGGAITVKRTWRKDGEDTNRPVDTNDTEKIYTALSAGWVISFPQGTTKPFVEGRKGTAHIIRNTNPIVVPIVIDGFRRAFDKKGLKKKKKGVPLRMTVKAPLNIDFEQPIEHILNQIMESIEQSENFLKVN
ncbi:MAG: hypothetical protein RL226_1637 [Bacteroidota bacterium]|jgi:1-acyl-sn-glycerol-3-phosphate acyltransferase